MTSICVRLDTELYEKIESERVRREEMAVSSKAIVQKKTMDFQNAAYRNHGMPRMSSNHDSSPVTPTRPAPLQVSKVETLGTNVVAQKLNV